MYKSILTSLIATIAYMILLLGGLAIGIIIAIGFESIFGSIISALRDHSPMLFIAINMVFIAALITSSLTLILKLPMNKLNSFNRLELIKLASNTFVSGFLFAFTFRSLFQVMLTVLFSDTFK